MIRPKLSAMSFYTLMLRLCDPLITVEPVDKDLSKFVFVMRRVEL